MEQETFVKVYAYFKGQLSNQYSLLEKNNNEHSALIKINYYIYNIESLLTKFYCL